MISIQKITTAQIEPFKRVRLKALEDAPSAFESTYAREVAFSDEEWLARVQRWEGRTGIGFLAVDHDTPCGIAGAFIDPKNPILAMLVSMWTASTHRRQGVGALLVAAVSDWAISRDVRRLHLIVTEKNAGGIAFYTKLGFSFTGRQWPYANDPTLRELEMDRAITAGP